MFGLWYERLTEDEINKILNTQEKISEFIRGFYESEGSITQNKIRIYNKNIELLKFVQALLETINFDFYIHSRICTYGNNAHTMYYLQKNTKATATNFFKIIKPCIKNFSHGGSAKV